MSDGVPQFSGPWKDDLQHAYATTTSDVVKQMLCDGGLTPEDVAELKAAFTSCLADVGITDVEFGDYGTMRITVPSSVSDQAVDAAKGSCEDGTGWYPVASLYYNMRQNPNKGDLDQMIADCLVRVGLEPAGFDGADVKAQFSDGGAGLSDISSSPLFMPCWYNPLSIP